MIEIKTALHIRLNMIILGLIGCKFISDVKSQLIGKDPDAGKDWRQEEKGTTEDEMVGWHHLLNGHEFEQTPGVKDREAWCAVVHGVTKIEHKLVTKQQQILENSDTALSPFTTL